MKFCKKDKNMNTLLEELSELEHEQWIKWSKEVCKTENISESRKSRWEKYWIPYNELTDDIKEFDREYARKILDLVKKYKEQLE